MVYKLQVMIPPFLSPLQSFLWPFDYPREWVGFNMCWRRQNEELKLDVHCFLPDLNASPGYGLRSLGNNVRHWYYLAIAYNGWDMRALYDEMVTRDVHAIKSCVWWKTKRSVKSRLRERGHTLEKNKNVHIPSRREKSQCCTQSITLYMCVLMCLPLFRVQ